MHHVVLERWSRRRSPLHALDARFKLVTFLVFLISLASLRPQPAWRFAVFPAMLLFATAAGQLPALGVLSRAALVLPFTAVFVAMSLLSGKTAFAVSLAAKSYLSAWAALVLAGTTPLPQLLRAAGSLGVPDVLILVTQFLYRYLFVLSEQAQHMRLAAECRTGKSSASLATGLGFRAAGGAVGVLFARSYQRAEGIHQAMLARGFDGHFPSATLQAPRFADWLMLLTVAAICAGARFAL